MDQDVEIPRRAEHSAEPVELGPERLRPLGYEQGTRGAEESPQAPRCDSDLVQLLRVVAEPDAGVVYEQLLVQPLETRLQMFDPRGVAPHSGNGCLRVESQGAHDLWTGIAAPRARPAQCPLDVLQRLLVALHDLDLEVTEASCHLATVEHCDLVHHD